MSTERKPNGVSRRGFASMDPVKRRDIASRGGKAAHALGVAHQWTSAEAAVAGKKGGLKVAENREHMMEIGMLGGKRRGEKRREALAQARQINPNPPVPVEQAPTVFGSDPRD